MYSSAAGTLAIAASRAFFAAAFSAAASSSFIDSILAVIALAFALISSAERDLSSSSEIVLLLTIPLSASICSEVYLLSSELRIAFAASTAFAYAVLAPLTLLTSISNSALILTAEIGITNKNSFSFSVSMTSITSPLLSALTVTPARESSPRSPESTVIVTVSPTFALSGMITEGAVASSAGV